MIAIWASPDTYFPGTQMLKKATTSPSGSPGQQPPPPAPLGTEAQSGQDVPRGDAEHRHPHGPDLPSGPCTLLRGGSCRPQLKQHSAAGIQASAGEGMWGRPGPAVPGKPPNFCLPYLLASVRLAVGSWLLLGLQALPTRVQELALRQLSHPLGPFPGTSDQLCPCLVLPLSAPTVRAQGAGPESTMAPTHGAQAWNTGVLLETCHPCSPQAFGSE